MLYTLLLLAFKVFIIVNTTAFISQINNRSCVLGNVFIKFCKDNICIAFKKNKIDAYPVKEKAIVKKERWFNYFIFKAGDKIFIRQRTEKDIWQGLHEYFLHESGREIKWSEKTIVSFLKKETSIYKPISVSFSKAKPQQLTHQLISGYFIEVKLNSIPSFLKNQYGQWVSADKLSAKAFPKFINSHPLQG